MTDKTPPAVEVARSVEVVCERCEGSGKSPWANPPKTPNYTCGSCDGTGKVAAKLVPGSLAAALLALGEAALIHSDAQRTWMKSPDLFGLEYNAALKTLTKLNEAIAAARAARPEREG